MVLMVRQYVSRGDIVWNFPGGNVELDETPEDACVREFKEETGYDVKVSRLIQKTDTKITFEVTIVGGSMQVDKSLPENADIIEARWIPIEENDKFDHVTRPIINQILNEREQC